MKLIRVLGIVLAVRVDKVNAMTVWNQMVNLVFLGLAAGAISMVISRSQLFNSFHVWLEKRSVFLEDLLSCPWCTSHWVSLVLTLVYHPLILSHQTTNWLIVPVDYFVTVMVMTVIAAVAAQIIVTAYNQGK